MKTNPVIRQELGHIERDPHSINGIMNPTEDEMMLAVDLDPATIQFFRERATHAVRWRALNNDPTVFVYFPNPTEEEKKYFFQNVAIARRLLYRLFPHFKEHPIAVWLQEHKVIF